MKNRMQDLDFEQTVAFDKVQDYEFTRRAAQRFRQVVSLDSFEDEDADVIFCCISAYCLIHTLTYAINK